MVSAKIVGPFENYNLVVDGYSVPFVEARENDGGTVTFIVDNRLAWTIPVAAFEDVAHLVATVYAIGVGLPCPPSETHNSATYARQMESVPAVMRPSRWHEIALTRVEEF